MELKRFNKPFEDWFDITIVSDVNDLIWTDDGRDASVGEFSLDGFRFSNLDAGDYIEIAGSPHIWQIDTAEYSEVDAVTRYQIIDAFCMVLKNRVLHRDLLIAQYDILSRVKTVIDEVNKYYPGLDGWTVTYKSIPSKLDAPQTNYSETSSSGTAIFDILYGIIESTSFCMTIRTRVNSSTGLSADIVLLSIDNHVSVPGDVNITRRPVIHGDRSFLLEDRKYDYAFAGKVSEDYDTNGTGPEQDDLYVNTDSSGTSTSTRFKNSMGGYETWTRANLILSPSTIIQMTTLSGAIPRPSIYTWNHRVWISGNVVLGTMTTAKNAIVVPYYGKEAGTILKRSEVYTPEGLETYYGWNGASVLKYNTETGSIAWSTMTVIHTSEQYPNEEITINGKKTKLSDLRTKILGPSRPGEIAVIGVMSISDYETILFPLSGSSDILIPFAFTAVNESTSDGGKTAAAPLLYPLDLWRVAYAGVKTVSNAIKSDALTTSMTAEIDVREDAFDLTPGTIGATIKTSYGPVFRITAVTTSFNDDGTVKRDADLMSID